jgi:predicted permease
VPDWKPEIRRRLQGLQLTPTREAAIVEELAQHLEDYYEDLLAGGATPPEAERRTLAELSGSEIFERELRRVERQVAPETVALGTNRRSNMIADLWQDLRYGARMLLKNPGFTLIAALTLALGIGVNTALFTGFNLLMRPRPVKDPESIVALTYQSGNSSRPLSFPDYVYFREHAQSFSDLLPTFNERFLLGEKTQGIAPEEIAGTFVSDNYLAALGGGLRLGRFFAPEENRVAGRDAVVVLSHHFWQRRFAEDPEVVGRSLLLNSKPFTVIGVTSPNFVGLQMEAPDLWLPLMMRAAMATVYFEDVSAENRDWFGRQDFQWLSLHARLKPGKTMAEAQAEMTLLFSQLSRDTPNADAQATITVTPYSGQAMRRTAFRNTMALVLGASGLILLIACSNIANMLLARAAMRASEIGVRLALGASRGRVIRQLLTESFLLAALGGVAGVLLAWWSVEMLLPWAFARSDGGDFARTTLSLAPDWRVLSFALLLTSLSGVAFGLIPALRATRPDLIAVIKDDSAAFGGRLARSWLRNGLVVAQVALCLALLIPAGLLLRALTRVLASERGFEAEKTLRVSYSLELSGYDLPRARLFQQQLMERLAALPGVERVSNERDFGGRVTIILPGEQGTGGHQFDQVPFQWVTAEYLETIGALLIQGRGFTAEEVMAKAPVIIVSEATARNLWPGENPLGKIMRVERRLRDGRGQIIMPAGQVIGVARDNQVYRAGQIPPMFFYAPQTPAAGLDDALLMRAARDTASVKELARQAAYALEPVLRLEVETLEERFANDGAISEARAASALAAGLGALALLLAALGLYGVMAFSVAQRTREIGIRMALGAQAGSVQRLVVKQGMSLVLIGVSIGAPVSLALAQVMKSLLFGLGAADPATYGGVVLLLAIVALLACWAPARRAARVDPMVALRHE